MEHDPRRGISLVEVLVGISITGILVCLVIPAVQSAREVARRVECLNNLKQLGLSIQAYAASSGVFPPVNLVTERFSDGVFYSQHEHSAFARILPYLEQRALFNAINFDGAPTHPGPLTCNDTALATRVGSLLCPSDRGTPIAGFGRVTYRVNHGASPLYSPDLADPATQNGPFCVHFVFSPSAFRDGLSQTIGISERLQGDWHKVSTRRGGAYLLQPAADPAGNDPEGAMAACRLLSGSGPHESRGGESWFLSGYHFTGYNHVAVPNWRGFDCAFDGAREDIHNRTIHDGVFSATSAHRGGVNAGSMDGSVRFVSDSIDLRVWRAFATRSGGEAIGGDAAL